MTTTEDEKNLKTLVNYTIDRHYPNIKNSKTATLDLLKIVIEKQIELVINWMRVGFIHGVMNTDNMAISGEQLIMVLVLSWILMIRKQYLAQ
mgnify:CR=1 FL=1